MAIVAASPLPLPSLPPLKSLAVSFTVMEACPGWSAIEAIMIIGLKELYSSAIGWIPRNLSNQGY